VSTPRRNQAWIGLGSNLADPAAQVAAAFAALDRLPGSTVRARSRLYRCAAWGVRDQPDFVNAVAQIETTLSPRALLDALLEIERAFGRDRSRAERWGPRVLDLDLLLYAAQRIDEPGLRVPHPHLHERAFVLVPLAEIAPDLDVPGHGSVARLLAALPPGGCFAVAAA
jgi:2-amino-4-hydroxy-6-hydroxymethyldihydropteridine diphosphokinase